MASPVSKIRAPLLSAKNLEKLELELSLLKVEPTVKLEYPCNDDSRNVEDFSEWSFFKDMRFHQIPVNRKATFLWCPALVDRIKKHTEYKQFVEVPKVKGYKDTQQNIARKKRAKQAQAKWRRQVDPSDAGATEGQLTARPKQHTKKGGKISAGAAKDKAARRSVSPERDRGRSRSRTNQSAGPRGQSRSQSRGNH